MKEIFLVIGTIFFRTFILIAAAYGTIKYLESLI